MRVQYVIGPLARMRLEIGLKYLLFWMFWESCVLFSDNKSYIAFIITNADRMKHYFGPAHNQFTQLWSKNRTIIKQWNQTNNANAALGIRHDDD